MKRKNRLVLNILSSSANKRKKYTIRKQNVLVQHPVNSSNDTYTATVANVDVEDLQFQDNEDSFTPETAYARRKLRLAENWTEVRDGLYATMISANALCNTECFSCQNPATVRCKQCGPFVMCSQCCLLHHTNCNIHHCPEVWKVIILPCQ